MAPQGMTDAAGSAGASGAAAGSALPADIDELWDRRASLTPADAVARDLVYEAVDMIDAGQSRVAWIDPPTDQVVVDERAKRAILLAFRLMPMVATQTGGFRYNDRGTLTTPVHHVPGRPPSIVRGG